MVLLFLSCLLIVHDLCTANVMLTTHINIRINSAGKIVLAWKISTSTNVTQSQNTCCTTWLITSEELVVAPWTVSHSAFHNGLYKRLIYICLQLLGWQLDCSALVSSTVNSVSAEILSRSHTTTNKTHKPPSNTASHSHSTSLSHNFYNTKVSICSTAACTCSYCCNSPVQWYIHCIASWKASWPG